MSLGALTYEQQLLRWFLVQVHNRNWLEGRIIAAVCGEKAGKDFEKGRGYPKTSCPDYGPERVWVYRSSWGGTEIHRAADTPIEDRRFGVCCQLYSRIGAQVRTGSIHGAMRGTFFCPVCGEEIAIKAAPQHATAKHVGEIDFDDLEFQRDRYGRLAASNAIQVARDAVMESGGFRVGLPKSEHVAWKGWLFCTICRERLALWSGGMVLHFAVPPGGEGMTTDTGSVLFHATTNEDGHGGERMAFDGEQVMAHFGCMGMSIRDFRPPTPAPLPP